MAIVDRVFIGGMPLNVRFLTNDSEHKLGYQYQSSKPSIDEGLLFIFDDEIPRIFHMENVSFDLALLAFDSKGNLVAHFPMHSVEKCDIDQQRPRYKVPPCRFVVECQPEFVASVKSKNKNLSF